MSSSRLLRCLTTAVFLLVSQPLFAAVELLPILSGLSSPIFAGNAGDGSNRLFVVEQPGVIKVLQPGATTPTVFLDIHNKVLSGGERGLLGLAFHPGYETNGRFFVYYTNGNGDIVIAEYHVSGDANVAGTSEIMLLTIPHPTNANHNGGMLAFGPDGYLYAGVGDGGSGDDPPNNAQNINVLLGKILRINVDNLPGGQSYTSPADNPYFGATPGRDEIFSIGWRNPWRFSFDRSTGQQWVADVGQGTREEVDTPIVKGGNYGWRVYEGTACSGNDPTLCDPANFIFPIFDYTHTGGRCSITGGYVYRGAQGVLPSGTYLYGDYCSGEIFTWDGHAQSLLMDTTMNISSFGEDEQGELYVVNLGGTVSKLVQTVSGPPGLLDIDASNTLTRYDALTDGILTLRYMFGLRGASMTVNALGGTASRSDPAAIAAYLDQNNASLDIDANGKVDALTDGLLIVRYLFGVRGDSLIQNAVGAGATRDTAASIEAYLATLTP